MQFLFILLSFLAFTSSLNKKFVQKKDIYKCIPCGYDCDKASYIKPGTCSSCKMELVKKSNIIFKTISSNAVCNYIKKYPNVVLLDVRTKEEFEGKADPNFGSLKNAINIPIQELESKLSSIQQLKNKEIIVYCSHSHRSPRASYLLTQNGFTKISNMAGGMSIFTDKSCMR